MRVFLTLFSLFAVTFFSLPQQAAAVDQETNFMITVKARDATFIGTAAGGAHIIVRNRRTGDIIMDGTTYGQTGDESKIMADSIARDAVLVDEKTAKLQFSFEFYEPLPVTISATVPSDLGGEKFTVSQDMLLIPNKDYTTGNGILLEVPGFVVDIIEPTPAQVQPFDKGAPFTVDARVMKLSGDYLAKDGPWDPSRYDVEVHIYKDGLHAMTVPLPYAEEAGLFSQNILAPAAGTYRFMVTAFDRQTKEAGLDSTTITFTQSQ